MPMPMLFVAGGEKVRIDLRCLQRSTRCVVFGTCMWWNALFVGRKEKSRGKVSGTSCSSEGKKIRGAKGVGRARVRQKERNERGAEVNSEATISSCSQFPSVGRAVSAALPTGGNCGSDCQIRINRSPSCIQKTSCRHRWSPLLRHWCRAVRLRSQWNRPSLLPPPSAIFFSRFRVLPSSVAGAVLEILICCTATSSSCSP